MYSIVKETQISIKTITKLTSSSSTMNSFQLTDWSSEPPLVLDQHYSDITTNNNAWAEEDVSSR